MVDSTGAARVRHRAVFLITRLNARERRLGAIAETFRECGHGCRSDHPRPAWLGIRHGQNPAPESDGGMPGSQQSSPTIAPHSKM